jgi:2-polyprenyl-3-methyl-5-hydroxy-6-metoxy-1,4-benzoquinol methylase
MISIYRPYYCPAGEVLQQVPRGCKVLEIGCGSGPMLFLLREFRQISHGRGVDSNAEAIAVAREANDDPALQFDVRDALELSREAFEEFDTILCFDLLHHIPPHDKATFLTRLIERMKPGSHLIVKDLDSRPRRKAFTNRVTDYLSTRSRVSYWRRSELIGFFHSHGLSVQHDADLADWAWSHYVVIAKK